MAKKTGPKQANTPDRTATNPDNQTDRDRAEDPISAETGAPREDDAAESAVVPGQDGVISADDGDALPEGEDTPAAEAVDIDVSAPVDADHLRTPDDAPDDATPSSPDDDMQDTPPENPDEVTLAPWSSTEPDDTTLAPQPQADQDDTTLAPPSQADQDDVTTPPSPLTDQDEATLAPPSQAEPDDAASPPPTEQMPPPPTPAKSGGSGVLAMITGGILAAVIGFGAARFVIPEGWPFGPISQATRDLTEAQGDLAARIGALEAATGGLEGQISAGIAAATESATALTESRFAGLEAQLSDLGAATATAQDSAATAADATATLASDAATARAALEARITALERQPTNEGAASDAAIQSFERELADLRGLLEAERARNAEAEAAAAARADAVEAEAAARAEEVQAEARLLAAQAEALSQQTKRASAITKITVALESGESFAGALDDLAATGDAVPQALLDGADGVATLESLQNDFAEPARAALAKLSGSDTTGQIGSFLRAQFGVRSLAPRDGDDPDAILSRAEAATKAGDLAQALVELGTLPEPGQAVMAGWMQAAATRQAALAAAATLAPE